MFTLLSLFGIFLAVLATLWFIATFMEFIVFTILWSVMGVFIFWSVAHIIGLIGP